MGALQGQLGEAGGSYLSLDETEEFGQQVRAPYEVSDLRREASQAQIGAAGVELETQTLTPFSQGGGLNSQGQAKLQDMIKRRLGI